MKASELMLPRIVNEIGIYDPSKTNRHSAPHLTRLYVQWRQLLYRATERFQKKRPGYEGTTVHQDFRHFTDFVEWAMQQVGWDKGTELDKDLLVKGNREYGPDKCVFLPPELNILLTNRARGRGAYPVGVMLIPKTGRFVARCSIYGKYEALGTYATPEDAFAAYKARKERHMREMAEKFKAEIDPRAYAAMIARQVEITD